MSLFFQNRFDEAELNVEMEKAVIPQLFENIDCLLHKHSLTSVFFDSVSSIDIKTYLYSLLLVRLMC